MPIYEYLCEKGHTFDAMQRMTDEPLTVCEVCGRPVRRVLQPVAVHFKGSGFYNTDYGTRKRQREKQASEASSKSSESKTKADSSDSSSTSSESKDSSSTKDSPKSDKKPAATSTKSPVKAGD
jgi:putative FmdB family regulatory protein